MALSIRLTKEQEAIVRAYARLRGVTVSEAFKKALFDEIEDEYDIIEGEEAYRKYTEDPSSAVSWEEAKRELDREWATG